MRYIITNDNIWLSIVIIMNNIITDINALKKETSLKDPLLARELVFQLLANETTFEELAEKHSLGAEKYSKGIVGPVPLTKSHPTVSQLLRSATPGVVLGPFQVGELSIILRLETLQEARLNAQIEQEMTQELFNEWLSEESQEIVRDLTDKCKSQKIAEVS